MKKVKNHLYVLTLLLCSLITSAQSIRPGTVVIDAGAGFGMYGIKYHSPTYEITQYGPGGTYSLPGISTSVGISKYLSVGINCRYARFGFSLPTYEVDCIGKDIVGGIDWHLFNKKEKFDLPIGLAGGWSMFSGPMSFDEHITTSGGLISIHISPHLYFGKNFGMFAGLRSKVFI